MLHVCFARRVVGGLRVAALRASCLAAALVLCLSVRADDIAPTKKQKEDLDVLVQLYVERLSDFLARVEEDVIRRTIRKAIYNQDYEQAEVDLRTALVELIAVDLGVDNEKGRQLVRRDLFDSFAKGIVSCDERVLYEYELGGAYKFDRRYEHLRPSSYILRAVLRHEDEVLAEIRASFQVTLDSDQKRGMAELASYYSERLHRRFSIGKTDKAFRDALVEALSTTDTDRAIIATVNKLRLLVRPLVVERSSSEHQIVAAEAEVGRRITQGLKGDLLLAELRADHAAMVQDPKKHRAVIKLKRK